MDIIKNKVYFSLILVILTLSYLTFGKKILDIDGVDFMKEDSGVFDKDKLKIIFMSEFNDSIEIKVNSINFFQGFIKTNESIGASLGKIEVVLEKGEPHAITFIIKNSPDCYSISFKGEFKFLYVWKYNSYWRHEFRNEILYLE